MSSTRYAETGTPLRQERFASSVPRGLLANLVAMRCAEINPPADRAAVWFAQERSWERGGLETLARDMLQRFPLAEWRAWFNETRLSEVKAQPGAMACALAEEIQRLCLDPQCPLAEVWEALDDYRKRWISEIEPHAETSIGRRVCEALDYAQTSRALTLIDGPARIGKSFAARAWCQKSGGLARYAQVPCSNDDASFFRAIGKSLGVSSSLKLKAAEMRARVEEVLQAGDLMLVLDEAHYLWPQQWCRYALPARVNWIMTALVNYNVPCVCVTTPQFYVSQQRVERLTEWTSEQFIGRIGHVERLPAKLGIRDLVKVAQALLPDGDASVWESLATYADVSKKHLASIEAIATRASWLAGKDGNQSATAAYVRRAIKESVFPSDSALAESLAPARKARRSSSARPPREARGSAAAAAPSIPMVDGPQDIHRGRAAVSLQCS